MGLFYEDDPEYWHEAVLLYPAPDKCYHILSPDGDEYVEDVACLMGTGPSKTTHCKADGTAAPDLDGIFYRFREYPSLESLRAKVMSLHDSEGADVTVPSKVLLPSGAFMKWPEFVSIDDGGSGRARTRAKAIAGPSTPRKPAPLHTLRVSIGTPGKESEEEEPPEVVDPGETDVNRLWVTTEEVAGVIEAYTEVEMKSSDKVLGDKGLHKLASGEVVMVKRLTTDDLERERSNQAGSDARVLTPVKYDGKGNRHETFSSAIGRMRVEAIDDFPLRNERSLAWLLEYVSTHGVTFDGRQTKWAVEQKIEPDTVPYIMHDLIGFVIELGCSFDQLDVTNLASFELLGRLYQLIEETQGTLNTEGFEHFIGRDARAGVRRGIALAPRLVSDAVSDQARETEILKQRRKAREERSLAGAGGSGGKNKKKGKDDPQHP